MQGEGDGPRRDIPQPGVAPGMWGSDAVADVLRSLEIPYLALNPGASFRGLHDSIVNRLGNSQPQLLLCLHELAAVSIAQGFAKVTDRAMAVALHANVGLLNGSMGIFNAWCDRAPMLVIGATGPVDAALRRPWIDWIHTARDQGALVRGFTKWDDQPASAQAAQESILRAWQFTNSVPRGPTYVCLDAAMQEQKLEAPLAAIDARRYLPPPPAAPGREAMQSALTLLASARRPVILAGRGSRDEQAWRNRVALAERSGARVLTDLKTAAVFPTDHPLHACAAAYLPNQEYVAALNAADLVLSLDWVDLGGTLAQAGAPSAKIIHVSCDAHLHRGWSMDYQALPALDAYLQCDPDAALPHLLNALPARSTDSAQSARSLAPSGPLAPLAQAIESAAGGPVCLVRAPLGWHGDLRAFRHPLDYLGLDGGGGIGSGPGIAVGAALALMGSGRIPVALLGDGDYLMGVQALWTAAHYRIPLLIVVCNNRSFGNDEAHQERIARARGRPVENRWIGQHIRDPEADICALARGLGCEAIGPVQNAVEIASAIATAMQRVRAGAACVVDLRVEY